MRKMTLLLAIGGMVLSLLVPTMRVIHGGWELAGFHMQVRISERRRRLL